MDEPSLVLLVEDDPSDERLALRALSRCGVPCSVHVARDGVEAIEYLESPETAVPKLVLLDLKLPKANGFEVLKKIRENARVSRIAVVCFSSSAESADVCDCFGLGANSFVRKPIDYHEYMECIARLTEYWLLINKSC